MSALRPTKLAVTSWVVYDLANTIFSMGVVSLFFPHFVERAVGPTQVDRVFGTIQSISYAIIFLVAPMLGAMTDRARRRMPFLVWTTIICVAATALLGRGSFLSSAVLFILANATYQAGIQFYDSLLVEVTTPENRGRISGIGTGVGYVGSYIAVALGMLLDESHFTEPVHFWPLFLWIAASFLVLSIPCFLFVKERGNPNPRPVFTTRAITSSLAETVATFRSGRQYPGLIRFLTGRIFYTDAVNTVIGYMAIYTMHVSRADGLSDQAAAGQRDLIMLSAITLAIPAGFVWGRLSDQLGPKRTLNMVLYTWMLTFAIAAAIGLFTLPVWLLYVVACLAGISLSGIWSSDRPLMLRLTPPHRIGEFYGLYGMVGRFSAIAGPAIWALTTWVFVEKSGLAPEQGGAIAILMLLGLVVLSYRILGPVSDAPRVWKQAEAPEQR